MRSHYNYVFDDITNTYNFTTKNNILYRVAFIIDGTFSSILNEEMPNVFQLIVEKASDELETFDAKVSKTVENIVERFFKKIENSLIYVCSDEGEKAKVRHKMFDRWYKNSEFKDSVVKLDNVINFPISQFETLKLYTSFMFRKENKNFEKLISTYKQIEVTLNSKDEN